MMTIEFTNDPDAKDDELSVNITLRGEPTKVINALAHGLPREALEQLRDAFIAETEKRAAR
jgi:hypothetical protein